MLRRSIGIRSTPVRVAALLATLILVPTLLGTGAARRVGQSLRLVDDETVLSSVVLDQQAQLWTLAKANGDLAFSFTTHNASDHVLRYQWRLTLAPEGAPATEAGSGSFALRPDGSRQQPIAARVADCARRTEVRVSVVPEGVTAAAEQIAFWVEPALTPLAVRDGRPTCGIIK